MFQIAEGVARVVGLLLYGCCVDGRCVDGRVSSVEFLLFVIRFNGVLHGIDAVLFANEFDELPE